MRPPRPGSRWSSTRGRRRTSYDRYMHSAAWTRGRNRWLEQHYTRSEEPPVCVVCGAGRFELHHLDYDRLGRETYDDLLPLCREHHRALHDAWDASTQWRRLGRRTGSAGIIAQLRAWHLHSRAAQPLLTAEPGEGEKPR